MAHNTYIHGTDSAEQERLTLLNRLTNQAFIDFLVLNDARSILEIGSGLGLLAEQIETAGFQDIELSIAPEIHYAGAPTFRPWVENLIGNVRSGAQELQKRQLATQGEITEAMAELQMFMQCDDASLFFYWNRASGRKAIR